MPVSLHSRGPEPATPVKWISRTADISPPDLGDRLRSVMGLASSCRRGRATALVLYRRSPQQLAGRSDVAGTPRSQLAGQQLRSALVGRAGPVRVHLQGHRSAARVT